MYYFLTFQFVLKDDLSKILFSSNLFFLSLMRLSCNYLNCILFDLLAQICYLTSRNAWFISRSLADRFVKQTIFLELFRLFWYFVFSEKSAIDHIFINISKCVHIILHASIHKINICLSLLRWLTGWLLLLPSSDCPHVYSQPFTNTDWVCLKNLLPWDWFIGG